jgi:hypothetical protein
MATECCYLFFTPRSFEDMGRVGDELSQLEHARALAAVQQEARRIASTLDHSLALQADNERHKASSQAHVRRADDT